MKIIVLLSALTFASAVHAQKQMTSERIFNLNTYQPHADGRSDDTPAFMRLFEDISRQGGGIVTIPAAVVFEKGGADVLVEGNVFKGSTGLIKRDQSDTTIIIGKNIGATVNTNNESSQVRFGN